MVSAPSKRSLQLWFMACYDLDRFRNFVASTGFNEACDIPWDEMQKLRQYRHRAHAVPLPLPAADHVW